MSLLRFNRITRRYSAAHYRVSQSISHYTKLHFERHDIYGWGWLPWLCR